MALGASSVPQSELQSNDCNEPDTLTQEDHRSPRFLPAPSIRLGRAPKGMPMLDERKVPLLGFLWWVLSMALQTD